jgi:hypothetical protein
MRFDERTTNEHSAGAHVSTESPSPCVGIDARSAVSYETKVFEASPLTARRARQGVMSALFGIAAVELRHVRMRNTVFCRFQCHLVFDVGNYRLRSRDVRLEKVGSCGRGSRLQNVEFLRFVILSPSSQAVLARYMSLNMTEDYQSSSAFAG